MQAVLPLRNVHSRLTSSYFSFKSPNLHCDLERLAVWNGKHTSNHFPLSLKVNACKDSRTSFNLSLDCSSIKLPLLSNFAGGWNAFKKNSGLLMKWRSRKTPTWRRWYWDRPPPKPPPALIIAAPLSAQTFGGLDAQSTAFFRGAGIVRIKNA